MPGSADFVQRFVHTLEAGSAAPWIRRALAVIGILAIALTYMYHFRGLATSQAMDQAQIGRSIASGHGWHTNFARPAAIGQLQARGKDIKRALWVDTYQAPLPPLVDAIALFPLKSRLQVNPRDLVYVGDKAIAVMSILLFLGAVVILFLVARRLFDQRLALLACGLVLLCDRIWEYSTSGLPQMLLLFLFHATVYALVRSVEAKYGGRAVGLWLVAVGAGFGLLALTHGLTIWMFVAALIFIAFLFRPRGRAAAIVLAAFILVYTPWLVRNFMVSGNPAGLAIYSALDGIRHSEAGWMRRVNFDFEGVGTGAFRDKIINNFISQTGRIFEYLGWSVVALMFFASLLHRFKRTETNVLLWMILAMWGGAVFGMALFGINEEQGFAANQLHLIFVPLMTCYGLAYLLVQFNRLEIEIPQARTGFIVVLFILCGFPIFNSLYNMVLGPPRQPMRWPPYIPPYIAVLNTWMTPAEITASDMPWAVAWYADRPSLWIPVSIKTLTDLSDYGALGGPVVALYLTPISGTQNTFRDIIKGDYSEWAPLIEQTTTLQGFPFKWGTLALGIDKECVFLSDHDRSRAESP
jgi:4-amino-4-deoxy-L-arabinose transferase-like glycosyltransferase